MYVGGIEVERSVCFTGYRPEKFSFLLVDTNEDYIALKHKIKTVIISLINKGYNTFYTGGCNGFDMIVGEILLDLKLDYDIKSIIVMPYISFGRNFDSRWTIVRQKLLNDSDETLYLYEKYKRGCYQDRNKFMVERSSIVVTYHNGQKGGTLNTINFAKKNKKNIVNLYEENYQISLEY